MIKTILIIVGLMAIFGGVLFAKGKVIKTDDGYKIKQTHTYYQSKIAWGEGYNDHVAESPITGIAVLAVGVGWTYATVTDANGTFRIKVKPGEPFKLRMSDGNEWVEHETELPGIPEGTTVSDFK